MKISLLNISSATLETRVSDVAIYKHFTADDAHRDTTGQNIQQGRLASSRNTLGAMISGALYIFVGDN